jgi:hypothetical protein
MLEIFTLVSLPLSLSFFFKEYGSLNNGVREGTAYIQAIDFSFV